MVKIRQHVILWSSVLLSILIGATSSISLCTNNFYVQETLNWRSQCIGQDLVNLSFILPVLLIAALLVFIGFSKAMFVWAGTLFYLVYTYIIYCFNVHFNMFFIEYCLVLGICVYLLMYFFFSYKENVFVERFRKLDALIALYFLALSVLFYCLWLSGILPAIEKNSLPNDLKEVGLFTNPVHVLDLSVFLPGFFITGVLILKRHSMGYVLIPIILTFILQMDITIAALTLIMNYKGVSVNLSVVWVMCCFAFLSFVLLILNLKRSRS